MRRGGKGQVGQGEASAGYIKEPRSDGRKGGQRRIPREKPRNRIAAKFNQRERCKKKREGV